MLARINTRICAIISTISNVYLIDGPLFPSSVNSKCPAIIFAVRRTANVPGRIRFLIVSMITMKSEDWLLWFSKHLVRTALRGPKR